jgi:oligosaccharide repeat unit polymerase
MFELYTIGIVVITVAGTSWAVLRANDTLHPLVYLMPMVGFFYVYMPLNQYRQEGLLKYFSLSEISYVQGFNLTCILALALGGWWGSGGLRRDSGKMDLFSYTAAPWKRRLLFQIGVGLGLLGLAAYLYQIANVGGFYAAYDDPKGGGWATSGYIREMNLMVMPAIVLIYMSRGQRALTLLRRCLIGVLSTPLLIHGLLSARRGPTFLAMATLVGGWYLVRRRRPSLATIAVGGAALGLLLLALVTFRGQIYLGSTFLTGDTPAATEIVEKSLRQSTRSTFGNEYMYGTYVVLNSRDEVGHYWGARYLTQVFVRPIPSSLWHNKYEAVGMEVMKYQAGHLGTTDLDKHPLIPQGSAPGFAASTYLEWGWGGPFFVFLLGWFYAYVWRQTLVRGGMWTIVYTILMATSAFLVAQTFIAVLFRVLLVTIPPIVLWKVLASGINRSSPVRVETA